MWDTMQRSVLLQRTCHAWCFGVMPNQQALIHAHQHQPIPCAASPMHAAGSKQIQQKHAVHVCINTVCASAMKEQNAVAPPPNKTAAALHDGAVFGSVASAVIQSAPLRETPFLKPLKQAPCSTNNTHCTQCSFYSSMHAHHKPYRADHQPITTSQATQHPSHCQHALKGSEHASCMRVD